jgi:actin-related protein 6
MGNERFSVPEVLFRPSYLGSSGQRMALLCVDKECIGLHQVGLATAIADSIALLPEELQGMFWANIGLVGGSTKFPGFGRRLYVLTFSFKGARN